MNIEQIKNTLREFQAENRQKFKNTQAEFKKAVSYIKKSVFKSPDGLLHPSPFAYMPYIPYMQASKVTELST